MSRDARCFDCFGAPLAVDCLTCKRPATHPHLKLDVPSRSLAGRWNHTSHSGLLAARVVVEGAQ